jgi:N-terminal domain of oxidoreductase
VSVNGRRYQLVRRPVGLLVEADFEIVSMELGDPSPDELLVQSVYFSVDPYHREEIAEPHVASPLLRSDSDPTTESKNRQTMDVSGNPSPARKPWLTSSYIPISLAGWQFAPRRQMR